MFTDFGRPYEDLVRRGDLLLKLEMNLELILATLREMHETIQELRCFGFKFVKPIELKPETT